MFSPGSNQTHFYRDIFHIDESIGRFLTLRVDVMKQKPWDLCEKYIEIMVQIPGADDPLRQMFKCGKENLGVFQMVMPLHSPGRWLYSISPDSQENVSLTVSIESKSSYHSQDPINTAACQIKSENSEV